MKRLLLLLLALLLLSGCGAQQQSATEPTTAPVETEAPGLYLPESKVEKGTNGAVLAYVLEGDGYVWAAPYAEDLSES